MLTEDAPSQTKEFVHCQHVCGTVNAPSGLVVAEDKQTLKPDTGLQGVASVQTFDPGTREQAFGGGFCPKAKPEKAQRIERRIALDVTLNPSLRRERDASAVCIGLTCIDPRSGHCLYVANAVDWC